MPKGMQIISGFVTAPSTTFTPWTYGSGDSPTVRNADPGSRVSLLSFWADNQSAGQLRIRSALLHDNVIGMTATVVASEVRPLFPIGAMQPLKPQDTLIVEQTGSGTTGDIESGSLLVYYDSLPGAAARLATWDQIKGRVEEYMYSYQTLSLGTAGGYSGAAAINTTVDQWKANRDYALLGYLCSAECASVGWYGPDTSNLRVGGPGNDSDNTITYNWFLNLSMMTGLPTIPIINAANKAATYMDGVQDENGVDVQVTSIFALLSGNF